MTSAPLLDDLNPAQRAAAQALRGPVCILAGAGTGKTRTITHRIAQQVAARVASTDQVLAVTFTDRAAAEMRARLARLGMPGTVRAATFHSAAWAQLRYFWPRICDLPLPDVRTSKVALLARAAARWKVEARDLAAEIEWAKARRLSPDDYVAAAAGRDIPLESGRLALIYRGYEDAKTQRNEIDYDDMILLTADLIRDHAEAAAEIRDRYRFFTVDEFQDVNPAQWTLLRAWLGDRDDVCVVGDDDQAIYSFAGASPAYLVGFRDHFPAAQVVTLTTNYRSTGAVLDVANKVLWTKPVQTRKHLESPEPGGPEPAFLALPDDDAEREAVVARTQRLVDDGVDPGEIAVIYRVNSQSEAWLNAFTDAAIPATVRGETGFFDLPEVRQAVRALRTEAGRDRPVEPGPGGALPARPMPADRQVEQILRDALSWHPRREPSGQAARERWRNLGAVHAAAVRLVTGDPSITLAGVVDNLTARAAGGADGPGGAGAVTLLTYHKAKGLEFDAVFLVAMEEGLLPISHAKTDQAIEEERRLLYVGVTRARRHLTLTWALRRPGWGGKVTSRRPSRLIYNLAPNGPQSAAKEPVTTPVVADRRHCGCGAVFTTTAARRRGTCLTCLAGGEPDPVVTQRLREWRSQRARDDDVPAFVVFADRTLAELAVRQPTDTAGLRRVHGLGPAKVDRYGQELLALLAGPGP